ncbi:MAG: amidohydrolase family protein [Hyphomonadaceae bacterium]
MQTEPVRFPNKAMPIFDVDTHWAEPPTLWSEKAPSKYKGKVFEVKDKPDNSQGWFVGDHQVAMIGPAVVKKDMTKMLGTFTVPRYDEMAPAVSIPEHTLDYMNNAGIGAQIVYPNVIGFGGQALMRVFPDDHELRLWHVQTYNDALAELQSRSRNRLLPQGALPLWDIDASVKELHRIKKLGLTGIAMSDKPSDFGQPTLVNAAWAPFWEAVQDLEIPVNFHIGSGSFEGELQKAWCEDKTVLYPDGSLNGPMAIYAALNNFLNNQLDVLNLILSGHLEKYPKIKYVSVESGCGWAPFLVQVMMFQWHEMMPAEQRKRQFKRTPLEMFNDQIYMTIYCEEHMNVDQFVAYFGPDKLLFETDFPHPTSIYPHAESRFKNAWEYADSVCKNLSAENKAKIIYRNAEKLYGVKIQTTDA